MQGAGQVREIKGEIRGPSCVPGRCRVAAAVPAPDSLSAAAQGGAVLPIHTREYLIKSNFEA